jgi:hypothetical protein
MKSFEEVKRKVKKIIPSLVLRRGRDRLEIIDITTWRLSFGLSDGWPHKVCELINTFGDRILIKLKKNNKKGSIYLEFSNMKTMRTIATSSCIKFLNTDEIKKQIIDSSKRAVKYYKC